MNYSARHHYIPQFYIRGFINDESILYVYDKRNDKIWDREISPKGIFYDWHRNTIIYKDQSSSIIEDYWFKNIDNECKKIIINLRESKNKESLHNIENVSKLLFFLIHLFWRIPKTDILIEYLFKNNDNKNQDNFDIGKKLERINLPNVIIMEVTQKKVSGRLCSRLFDKGKDLFLIGDYPMLYNRHPKNLNDILNQDVIIPISSKRLHSISFKSEMNLNFSFEMAIYLNILIIDQSERYVCSPNKEFLIEIIKRYKMFNKLKSFDYIRDELFKQLNTGTNK